MDRWMDACVGVGSIDGWILSFPFRDIGILCLF